MPNIKPISDLRNYSEVLHDVAVGAPVFLTKNGRGRYAIIDIQDYEKTQATIRLMNELENPDADLATVSRITEKIRFLKNQAYVGTPLSSVADTESDYRCADR